MLSLKYVLKVGQMNAQYGAPEDSFSPRWHADHPTPSTDAVLPLQKGTQDSIKVCLRHVLLPSGDMTVANVSQGYELPQGARFVD